MTTDPLDAPVWSSLTGAHAHLAQGLPGEWPEGGPRGFALALRYPGDVSPFCAVHPEALAAGVAAPTFRDAWEQLAELLGPGGLGLVSGPVGTYAQLPAGWSVEALIPGVQMVATGATAGRSDPEAVELGDPDVDDMVDLVARTEPGPFARQTRILGRYLGIRREGKLVAMAGERMHPPGHHEVSAVCTDPAYRGQGLAGRLIDAVVAGIRERGDVPILHAASDNPAIALYRRQGFEFRDGRDFVLLRAPGQPAEGDGPTGQAWGVADAAGGSSGAVG